MEVIITAAQLYQHKKILNGVVFYRTLGDMRVLVRQCCPDAEVTKLLIDIKQQTYEGQEEE